MVSSRLALAVLSSALVSNAVAQLTILAPGGPNLWWVDQSVNTLAWNCNQNTQYPQFNVLIANSGQSSPPQAILATVDNFLCSKTIDANLFNLPAATGYTLQLSNTFNDTDVYTTSQPFEIKALGSAYPNPSSTPTAGGSSSVSGSGSGSASAPSSTTTRSDGVKATFSGLTAVLAMALGVLAA